PAGRLSMRSVNPSVGEAQKGTAPARSMEKRRSGTRGLGHGFGGGIEAGKEAPDFIPRFAAAGKAAPVRADDADQPVAGVDRREIVRRRRHAAQLSDPV